MQIHELNNYKGALGSSAFIAVDNGSDTGKISTTDLLSETNREISDLDSSLNARIDNIIAGGAAPSESEIVDARMGADGVIYPSLGDAIRTPIEQLSNGAGIRSNNRSLLNSFEAGSYRNAATGNIGSNADYNLYDFIPVIEGESYYLGITSNTHICFWDSMKTYLSGIVTPNMTNPTPTIAISGLTFTAPQKAAYASISVNKNYKIGVYPLGQIAEYNNDLPVKVAGNIPTHRLENIINLPDNFIKKSGPNLLDKNVVIQGYYISEASGRLIPSGDFSAYYMPVNEETVYTTTGFQNNHYAIVNPTGEFVRGGVLQGDATIEIPAGGAYLGVSCLNSKINSMAICEGTEAVYSDFGKGAVYEINSNTYLTVGPNGSYRTISEAVQAASDGDIILISEGTYNESIDVGSKRIVLEGATRDGTILEYSNSDYKYPPLTIGRGTVRNLTIRCYTGSGSNKAYCAHIDNINLQNSKLLFENVLFNNPDKPCVGIGLRGGCSLEFKDCTFIGGTQSAFYAHDWDSSSAAGVEQFLSLVNCFFLNNSSGNPTIQLQSQEIPNSSIGARFQRNIVSNINNGGPVIGMRLWNESIGGGGYLGSSRWYLAIGSALNTDSQMNR